MVLGILAARERRRQAVERAKARSNAIDRQIEEEGKIYKRTCNVLLMGSLCFFNLVLYFILSLGLISSSQQELTTPKAP